MKAKRKLILVPFLSLVLPAGPQAADVLEPAATIGLPSVKGRIDHFGVDLKQQRLFVGARKPAVLLVYDIDSGKVVAKQPIGEDTDDIFFDPERKRLYVICGEGRIDIVRQENPDRYSLESTVRTAPCARTGLFVPEEGRLYVAAPAIGTSPAKLLAYRVR